ncbi:MAG: 3-oxoadipate enol-lactonase [Actinomycetota bacterium]|nr:3-oxoadipate enol-lactonase [Actinomycetota bacterium]
MTYVQTGDIRIHVHVDGPDDAPVVLFSNSLGADLRMWDAQAEAFAGRFRVVRYDGRGQGGSDTPEGPYTIEALGGDALAVLDALEVERAHICGISMGGLVAQRLAAIHPERVDRAVYANTAAKIGSDEMWDARIAAVRTGGMKAIRDAVLGRFFTDSFGDTEVVRRTSDTFTAASPEGYVNLCYAVRNADLRPLVGSIRAPSLVVAGAHDVATPPAEARWLHERIPGSELVVVADAAHLSNVEQPNRFNQAVLDFLDREAG